MTSQEASTVHGKGLRRCHSNFGDRDGDTALGRSTGDASLCLWEVKQNAGLRARKPGGNAGLQPNFQIGKLEMGIAEGTVCLEAITVIRDLGRLSSECETKRIHSLIQCIKGGRVSERGRPRRGRRWGAQRARSGHQI